MARSFCIPGILFLTAAFILSLLVTISLPFLKPMDITRVYTNNQQLRLGIWAYCSESTGSGWACGPTKLGYTVNLNVAGAGGQTVGSSWTRGLILHPIATGITFIAWLLAFSEHVTVSLVASLFSFLAALFTLIAFAIDIALYARVRHQINDLNTIQKNTNTGPGFWMTFASLILLLLAGCTVCFGRRRERINRGDNYHSNYSYAKRPWYSRFGRRY